jgi:hypothetical protein
MSLPASDILTSGSDQALSSNWTTLVGSYHTQALGAYPVSNGDCAAFWNADAFPNDQYSQAQVATSSDATGAYNGVLVRSGTAGGTNAYAFRYNTFNSVWQVSKIVAGAYTNLSGSQASTFATNDIIKLTVVGITLTAYQNSTVLYTTTDSSLTSGPAGIYGNNPTTNGPIYITNWQGGSLASGGPQNQLMMSRRYVPIIESR